MVYVRVLCGVRYVSMGLRQEEDIIQPMERMTSSGDRHQDCRVQVQVEHHEEIKCLKLAIHCGVNGLCEDVPKSGSPIVEYREAIIWSSSSQHNQERWSNLRESRSSSSSSSGPCARQRFALDRFSILPVSWW